MLSKGDASEYSKTYVTVLEKINEITDPDQRIKALKLFEQADLFSAEGIANL
jgi:hypothetical protein